jgi:DHA2 family methylenomycin A resistance protein-like MFS transporter
MIALMAVRGCFLDHRRSRRRHRGARIRARRVGEAREGERHALAKWGRCFVARRSIDVQGGDTVEAMNASTRALAFTVATTSLGFAVVQLDVTIVNVALPRIADELGASLAWLQWVVDAYTLSFAVLLLSAGALCDRIGARRAYAAGLAAFALASALCAFAPDVRWLVTARALQGVGAALLLPSSLALLNAACGDNGKARARAVAFWTAAGGVSIAAGPIAGGILLTAFGWRSVFLVNIPICAAAIAFVMRQRVPISRHPARAFDIRGQLLAIVSLIALVGSIIEASSQHARPPIFVIGAAITLLGAIAFRIVEARAEAPMFPLTLLARPGFARAVLFGVAANLTYYGIVFVLCLYLQQVRHYSALDTGLAYLPLTATFIVSNIASGALVSRSGTRTPMVAGALIGAAGFVLIARLDATSSFIQMLPGFTLVPFGMGLAVPAMTATVLASVDRSFAGTASGALNAARQVGGALGVAAFGALASHMNLVTALQAAAASSAALMVVAALIAWGNQPTVRGFIRLPGARAIAFVTRRGNP